MLIHLRVIPDFWTSVEERDRPELRTQAVIIGGLPNERGLVREANMTARYCGIQVGMTLSQAYQQCPEGIFLNPDLLRYQDVWDDVCEVLQRFTPKVEPVEMGQAFLDLSRGSGETDVCNASLQAQNWHEGTAIASEIQTHAGINSWIGIAANRLTAQLASTQGAITFVEPGSERQFLADLPITLLPDLDPRTTATFQILGLKTIGQLADLPASAVRLRFGLLGERLHNYARGIDSRPVIPPPAEPSIAIRRDCEEGSLEEAVEVIHRLSMECAGELEKSNLAGRLIGLTLIWEPVRKRTSICESPTNVYEANTSLPTHNALRTTQNSQLTTHNSQLALPVPYRIHSMLPQPKPSMAATLQPTPPSFSNDDPIVLPAPITFAPAPKPTSRKFTTLVRTPISSGSQLFERARKLLFEAWPEAENAGLDALELEIGQFEQPAQLAFSELNRLDQTGRFAGLDPGRMQAIAQQEEALTARYGDDPFRHIAALDPAGTLTERRFKWGKGIPWRRPS